MLEEQKNVLRSIYKQYYYFETILDLLNKDIKNVTYEQKARIADQITKSANYNFNIGQNERLKFAIKDGYKIDLILDKVMRQCDKILTLI